MEPWSTNHSSFLLVLWLQVFCIFPIFAHPVLNYPTSEVYFTRYAPVLPAEWEEFYRNRGTESKPNIPGAKFPGTIPVSHYAYEITHPSRRRTEMFSKRKATKPNGFDPDSIIFVDRELPHKITLPPQLTNGQIEVSTSPTITFIDNNSSQQVFPPSSKMSMRRPKPTTSDDVAALVEEFEQFLAGREVHIQNPVNVDSPITFRETY